MDISGAPTGTAARYEFFSNIVRHVIRDHGIVDRRWFIAYNGEVELPPLDRDCIVFVYGDERSLLPWRYRKAGLILKCMGFEPYTTEEPRPDLAWVLDRLRIARNRAQNATIKTRLGRDREAALVARILPFPLGYARQPELPLKPLRDRRHLMWFSGSFLNAGGPPWALMQRLADEPKFAARRRMVAAVREIRAAQPNWPIDLDMLHAYADSRNAPDGYAANMMDTKIALVPRGVTAETHRFHEAMRAGCVVIGEALPDFWFYRSAPALRLRHWRALPALLAELTAAPDRLQALHEASCRWWREVCSPVALAATVAGILSGRETVADIRDRSVPQLEPAASHVLASLSSLC